jgi:hypothetical protein
MYFAIVDLLEITGRLSTLTLAGRTGQPRIDTAAEASLSPAALRGRDQGINSRGPDSHPDKTRHSDQVRPGAG